MKISDSELDQLLRSVLHEAAKEYFRNFRQRYRCEITFEGGHFVMAYKAWHLAAMEDAGYMDTNTGLINRVARELSHSSNDVIDTEEFRSACYAVGVDPDFFTQEDLDELQRKLNRLT